MPKIWEKGLKIGANRIETANLNETDLTLTIILRVDSMLIDDKLIIANLEIRCSRVPFR